MLSLVTSLQSHVLLVPVLVFIVAFVFVKCDVEWLSDHGNMDPQQDQLCKAVMLHDVLG